MVRAGVDYRVRIRVRDWVRINNGVRVRLELINYSLTTALPVVTSADSQIRSAAFYLWPPPVPSALIALVNSVKK